MKKLDEQRKRLHKQLRETENFTDMDTLFLEGHKERWQRGLQEIEQKRNDLLLEHQKLQKRSPQLQTLQDKKKKCLKDACVCDEEMERVRKGDLLSRARAEVAEASVGSRRFGGRDQDFASRRT